MRNCLQASFARRCRFALLGAAAAIIFSSSIPPTAAQNAASGSSKAAAPWRPVKPRLATRWDKDVSTSNPLPEYPRPQLTRKNWQSLNGKWDYALSDKAATDIPTSYTGQILVPYPMESALSGVQKPSVPDQRLWYRRSFTVPASWQGQQVILHFGAVNWDSTVTVNGTAIGTHRGGYDAFSFDITSALKPGENELVVSAWNPLLADTPTAQVLGKQRMIPSGIFYTGVTGIWQTVWIEPVPAAHITSLKMIPDIDAAVLRLIVQVEGGASGQKIQVTALDGSRTVAQSEGDPGNELRIPIPSPKLWSPANPHLYTLKVSLSSNGNAADNVDSYFAMRKINLGKDDQGRTRIFLNNKFVFQIGALDQGYWPDGIYTAPTDSALKFDIDIAKKLGMNLLRKHAKVEPDRWYYWTDKLGMLVWQDMPQGFTDKEGMSDEGKQQFETELRRLIAGLFNHPSIIVWTAFNEGWGQHDTKQIVDLIKRLDPDRLVNNASGWNDEKVGDLADTHAYPGPWSGLPEPTRAAVNGEFGGVTMRVPGHMWTEDLFGYGTTLKDSKQVAKRYRQLLQKAYRLRDVKGTSAFVYTQLTDVEQESNGLLTYDRSIMKANAADITSANLGHFPAVALKPEILPTSEYEPQTWRYTTDKPAENWSQLSFVDLDWKMAPAPFGHEVGGIQTEWTTGDIWLRREVTLAASLPAKLEFQVTHDEDVEIYINGVLAASANGYSSEYVSLPINAAGRAALKPGKNLIAVHCHQTTGAQVIDLGIGIPE